jgi:hypothetical protein
MKGTPMRNCGECNACCSSIPIDEFTFKKPYGTLCRYWIAETRCSVYPCRPKSCRDFYCDWLKGEIGGKHCRPDRLGVIFDSVTDLPQGKTLQVWEYEKGALNKSFVREYMKRRHKQGWFIMAWNTELVKRIYLPEGWSPESVKFTGEILLGSTL